MAWIRVPRHNQPINNQVCGSFRCLLRR